MNALNPDYQFNRRSRAGGNPAKTIKPRCEQNPGSAPLRRNFFISWIPACAGMTQPWPIGLPGLIAALLFTCITIPHSAHAGQLGRLFFTPEQRAQLDYTHARDAAADGDSSAILTVNGIVQKNGGARTVWVNGVAQSADGGERNTTAQSVNIPGKSRPVKLKVGDKIMLDQPSPASQESSSQ
jgi:hypothetical protein